MQIGGQQVVPPSQVMAQPVQAGAFGGAHVEPQQASLPLQPRSQPPQWVVLVRVSAQRPPQQDAPLAQARPQSPQLATSLATSRQSP